MEVEALPVGGEVAVAQKRGDPRLVIAEIRLENFKSYGGTRVIGPFHSQFSSIVGPNGSGKSNVIDAMLFVFGKRAKKIRLNKVSELIHNSKDNENLASAKVTVSFHEVVDVGEGANASVEKVPKSDFSVGREAFRNNQSKYYLNGKGSNFTEVTQVLGEKGIDLEHNRFLILQGEVENIAMMKPKAQTEHEEGLLEYLEDLIGSNVHAPKIAEATKELEAVSDRRQEKMNRMRAAEKEKDALEGPRKEAEEYVRMEAAHLEQRARLHQLERFKGVETCDKAKADMEAAQGRLEEVRSKIKDEEKIVKEIDAQLTEQNKKLDVVRKDMEKAREAFTKFEQEDIKLTEERKFNETKQKKLEGAVKQEQMKAERLHEQAEEILQAVPNGEQALAQAEKQLENEKAKLEHQMKDVRGLTEKLGKDKQVEEKALAEVRKKQNVAQQHAEIAHAEMKAITQRRDNLENQRIEIEQGITGADEKFKARNIEAKAVIKERDGACKEHAKLEKEMQKFAKEGQELGDQLRAARGQFEEARNMLASQANKSQLVRSVMSAVKTGTLGGVHGRLGDLGTIDSKYDVAISTACGALDHLVVDTTEDAQAAVEFLRENNLGRTTFIILDKVTGRKLNEDRPENLPRLLDLVKPTSPAYKVAFQYALGDTLVSDNLDQATRVGLQSKQRRRVVTLDGKLIDASGTMSGGGTTVAKGGMKSTASDITETDVNKLGMKCEELQKAVNAAKQGAASAEAALHSAEKRAKDAEMRARQIEMEVKSIAEQKKILQERLAQCPVAEFTAAEKEQMKGAQKTLDEKTKELDKIVEVASKHEEKIAKLHDEIMNAGGWQLAKKKKDVEEAKQNVESIQKKLAKMRVEAETATKNAAKAKQAAEKAQDEMDAVTKTVLALEEKRKKLDEQAEKVLVNFQATRDTLASKEAELNGLKEQRDEIAAGYAEAKKVEVDAMHELDTKQKVLKETEGAVFNSSKMLVGVRKEFKALPLDLLSEELVDEDGISAIRDDFEPEVLKTLNARDIEARMLTLEGNINQMKPNLSVIADYRTKLAAFQDKQAEYEKVNEERDEKRRELDAIRQKRLDEFMGGFSTISMKLKEMYQMITLGGDAELELVDTLDPFSEGIHFSVRPPKKSWKQIQNLSGGEKTLSSLALVFALHYYKPTPLYFMDEIDAALDFRNVSIIANYIKERTKNAQFIIISLRNHMFEVADRLMGIYKTHDQSKSVTISPSAFGPLQGADNRLNSNAAVLKDGAA